MWILDASVVCKRLPRQRTSYYKQTARWEHAITRQRAAVRGISAVFPNYQEVFAVPIARRWMRGAVPESLERRPQPQQTGVPGAMRMGRKRPTGALSRTSRTTWTAQTP